MKNKVVLIYGNHDFLRSTAKQKFLNSLKEKNNLTVTKFYLNSDPNKEVESAIKQKLLNSSLFATDEAIVLKLLPKEDRKQKLSLKIWDEFISECIPQIPENITLLIDVTYKVAKSSKVYKMVSEINGIIKEYHLKENEKIFKLRDFINSFLRKEEIKIDRILIDKLISTSQGNWWYVFNALEQAAIYLNSQKKKEDNEGIEKLWSEIQEKNVWHILDSVVKGEKTKVFNLLYELLQEENRGLTEVEATLGFISLLARQLRQLLALKENTPSKEAFTDWRVQYFMYDKTKYQAGKFSDKFLAESFLKIADTQEKIKSGQYSPLSIVDFFLFYFMSHRKLS